ncbi:MAG: filamentous hemagglutinin N-terminal domain-containing protein [Cyanobacteria bacterium J06639_18]
MKYQKILFSLVRNNILFFMLFTLPVTAQITTDKTLPVNSRIKQQGNVTFIEGGTRAGKNLFHSLKELSVPSNGIVYFNNASDIQNIFTRITDSFSNIDGLIRSNGTANLFLINPNGITFGKNSSLDVGGSLFVSTASSIKFADGFKYTSTSNSEPLLTISVPIGMGFASNTGGIQVQDSLNLTEQNQQLSPIFRGVKPSGLFVRSGNTLALIAGNLSLDGARLTAEDGKIELGSVGKGSFVNLTQKNRKWALNYDKASLRNVQLSTATLLDASGINGGSIQIQGAGVDITDGSVVLIQNIGSQGQPSLKINATESLELSGSRTSNLRIATLGLRDTTINSVSPKFRDLLKKERRVIGKAADIKISTKSLSLQDGARIGSTTNNKASGGNITIEAESVEIIGRSTLNPNRNSSIISFTTGDTNTDGNFIRGGKAGNINISTKYLTAKDGGQVVGSSIGSGEGGNLIINSTYSIGIVSPQSFLGTRAFNVGNAGNVTISTTKLTATDGGRVDTSTLGPGSAGSITIDAQSVNLSGTDKALGRLVPSSITSSANIPSQSAQRFFGIPAIPTGKSGEITINTEELRIGNGAEVSVKNEGTGNAGSIKINSDKLNLNTQGKITAATASGEGGDIILQSNDLRSRQGEITTSAGGTGNGGDITIKGDTITALEKSAIRANAFEGRGGNIKIKATGLFVSPNSQITATSERGVDGNIEIDVEESNLGISFKVDPGFRFRKLPLFCGKDSDVVVQPSLVNVGKGSLPFDPEEAFINNLGWHDTSEDGDKNNSSKKIEEKEEEVEVIEAQGWVENGDGTVSFTASPPDEVIVGDSLLKSMCKIY